MKNKITFPSQPPEDHNSKFTRSLKKMSIILRELSNFLSKDLLDFVYKLAVISLIIQLLLMGTGLMEFSWEKVGLTSFIIFILKSTNWKGLL